MVKAKLEDLINIVVRSSLKKHPLLPSLEAGAAILVWEEGRDHVIAPFSLSKSRTWSRDRSILAVKTVGFEGELGMRMAWGSTGQPAAHEGGSIPAALPAKRRKRIH